LGWLLSALLLQIIWGVSHLFRPEFNCFDRICQINKLPAGKTVSQKKRILIFKKLTSQNLHIVYLKSSSKVFSRAGVPESDIDFSRVRR
jgi:hypothetical protein